MNQNDVIRGVFAQVVAKHGLRKDGKYNSKARHAVKALISHRERDTKLASFKMRIVGGGEASNKTIGMVRATVYQDAAAAPFVSGVYRVAFEHLNCVDGMKSKIMWYLPEEIKTKAPVFCLVRTRRHYIRAEDAKELYSLLNMLMSFKTTEEEDQAGNPGDDVVYYGAGNYPPTLPTKTEPTGATKKTEATSFKATTTIKVKKNKPTTAPSSTSTKTTKRSKSPSKKTKTLLVGLRDDIKGGDKGGKEFRKEVEDVVHGLFGQPGKVNKVEVPEDFDPEVDNPARLGIKGKVAGADWNAGEPVPEDPKVAVEEPAKQEEAPPLVNPVEEADEYMRNVRDARFAEGANEDFDNDFEEEEEN